MRRAEQAERVSREILRLDDCNSLAMMIFTIVDNDQVSGAMRRHGIDCGTLARGVKVDLVILFIFLWLIIDHHDILEGGHLKQEPLPLHPLQSQVAAKHLWMKNRHPGATTLHTPTLGSPAQRTGGGELGEISKHLRTGSCQGFPVELSRAGDFEASTQKIR